MCSPPKPSVPKAPPAEDTIPPPTPPPEPTAQAPEDSPSIQKKRKASSNRKGTSALRIDLSIPSAANANGVNIPR